MKKSWSKLLTVILAATTYLYSFSAISVSAEISSVESMPNMITAESVSLSTVTDVSPEQFFEKESIEAAKDTLWGPVILEEDVEKRGEYEKHFLCDDGSYMAVSYPVPVHMLQNEKWVDISHTLNLQEGRYTDVQNSLGVSFASRFHDNGSKLVQLGSKGKMVSWSIDPCIAEGKSTASTTATVKSSEELRPSINPTEVSSRRALLIEQKSLLKTAVDAELTAISADTLQKGGLLSEGKAAAEEGRQEEAEKQLSPETRQALTALNTEIDAYNRSLITDVCLSRTQIAYEKALGNYVDVRYMVLPDCIKEEIVLSQKDASFTSYAVRLNAEGMSVVADEEGGYILCDAEGEGVYYIAPPFMYDAIDSTSFDVAVALAEDEEGYVITYTPSQEWLNAPERVYPVVIDPTFTSVGSGYSQSSTYVYSGQTSGSHALEPYLFVGYYTRNSALREHVAFWKMNTLPTMTSASISNAKLYLRLANNTTTMGNGIYLANTGTGWNASSLTSWAALPQEGSSISYWTSSSIPPSNPKWINANVTAYVRNWYATGINNGFMLRYLSSVNDWNQFYSAAHTSASNIPYLTITYNVEVPVTSVAISNTSLELRTGDAVQLSASVFPLNAPQGITWSSNHSNIASVSGTGRVTAVSVGTAVIYAASTADPSKYATCTIVVKATPTSVVLSPSSVVLTKGNSLRIEAEVFPTVAYQGLTWGVEETGIVTVAQDGTVTAIGPGDVRVFARSDANAAIVGYCNVTVVLVNSVAITPERDTHSVQQGTTFDLSATVFPLIADQRITWSVVSQTPKTPGASPVITVDSTGLVTAVNLGEAIVKAASSAMPEKSATYIIKVSEYNQELILFKNQTKQLEESLYSGGFGSGVILSSDNTSVASVTSAGVVQAVGPGTAYITVSSSVAPYVCGVCQVVVLEPYVVVCSYYDTLFQTEIGNLHQTSLITSRTFNFVSAYFSQQLGINLPAPDLEYYNPASIPDDVNEHLNNFAQFLPLSFYESTPEERFNIPLLWTGKTNGVAMIYPCINQRIIFISPMSDITGSPSNGTVSASKEDIYKVCCLHEILHYLGVSGDWTCHNECIMSYDYHISVRANFLNTKSPSQYLCAKCKAELYNHLENVLIWGLL